MLIFSLGVTMGVLFTLFPSLSLGSPICMHAGRNLVIVGVEQKNALLDWGRDKEVHLVNTFFPFYRRD